MAKTISIDPVTRIEGHARISLFLEDDGTVYDCRLHITQLRGFDAFCVGRPLEEMPALTARTCGICPVSHLLASAKACDELLAVRIPPAAQRLRRLLNYGQLVQSHALSFFYLSAPDLLLGMDSDPKKRNIFGVAQRFPEVARAGVALRRFGQQIIERLAGKRIHPTWVVPGGVSRPLSRENQQAILAELPETLKAARKSLRLFPDLLSCFADEIANFANFPSHYLALGGPAGMLEYYDGPLRMIDERRQTVFSEPSPSRYGVHLGEAVEPDSYLKSPYYRPLGPKAGLYRTGPLARLNAASACGTPGADEALIAFRALAPTGMAVQSSFYYHYARLIEIIHSLEKIGELLADPVILENRVRATADANDPEGVGICEAPRGTLIHHYQIDDQGRISSVNMIIATGHNNLALNRGILQAARAFIGPAKPQAWDQTTTAEPVTGKIQGSNRGESGRRRTGPGPQAQIREGLLNRIEGVMPLAVELRRREDGALIGNV